MRHRSGKSVPLIYLVFGRGYAPLLVLHGIIVVNEGRSVGSIDEVLNGDSTEHSGDAWRPELADRIEETLARKGSTVQGREKCYKAYVHILTAQYAEEEIRGKEAELVVAFLKSIKEEKTEKETILAMKGTNNPHHLSIVPDEADLVFICSSRHDPHDLPL